MLVALLFFLDVFDLYIVSVSMNLRCASIIHASRSDKVLIFIN